MSGLRTIRSRRAVFGLLCNSAVALIPSLAAIRASAQEPETGRIVGRVVDANTGQGIVDAGIQVNLTKDQVRDLPPAQ